MRGGTTKYYLVNLAFKVGEIELPFYHTTAAKSLEGARKRVHRYFRGFYGRGESRTVTPFKRYEYLDGEVMVDVISVGEYLTQEEAERTLFEKLKI